jgi:hypothetical protein
VDLAAKPRRCQSLRRILEVRSGGSSVTGPSSWRVGLAERRSMACLGLTDQPDTEHTVTIEEPPVGGEQLTLT